MTSLFYFIYVFTLSFIHSALRLFKYVLFLHLQMTSASSFSHWRVDDGGGNIGFFANI